MEQYSPSVAPLLGLQESELKVFSALLQLGKSDVSRLADRAELPRTTVYSILDRLGSFGLVAREKKTHGSKFIPSSPDALVALAEEKLERARQGVEVSKKIAELLRTRLGRDSLAKAKVQFFEGEKALRAMLYDQVPSWRSSFIKMGSAWFGFQDDSIIKTYGDWVEDYWTRFKNAPDEKKDIVKLFSNSTQIERTFDKKVRPIAGARRNLKPLPSGMTFTATIWVMGEYVTTLKTRESPHEAIVTWDPILSENLSVIFEYLWNVT